MDGIQRAKDPTGRSPARSLDVASLVDDRVEEGTFRVDKRVFLDRAIFDEEMARIFEANWVFLCHESQIARTGDFFTTTMGRQPVFVMRQKDGSIRAFLNACTHRNSQLLSTRQGQCRGALTCRFHGWAFGLDGRCLKIKFEEQGGYAGGAARREAFDLHAVPVVESYRGFVFGSLAAGVEPLERFLGPAAAFLDLFVDQSPEGLEILRGSSTYVVRHNWKIQNENVTDGYHTPTVHRVFAETMMNRESRDGLTGLLRTETGRIRGTVKTGCYDLGHGHMAIWADRATPDCAPLYPATERIERTHPPGKARWMLRRGRNLMVFPNLIMNDLASTHLRTVRPLAPDRTEITIWCIAPVGESDEGRYARLRKFEDFFLVTGFATSDDVCSLDSAQVGSGATARPWTDYARGMATMQPGADDAARELGIEPASSNASWDHETPYFGMYRHWVRELTRETSGVPRAA